MMLGRRLGDPWVTRGSRLGRIEQMLCLQQSLENAGWGGQIAAIADIARDRRDRKGKPLPRINTDGRGSAKGGINRGDAVVGLPEPLEIARDRKSKTGIKHRRQRSWHFWIAQLAVQAEILLPSGGFRLTMLAQGPQKRIPRKSRHLFGQHRGNKCHINIPF